MENKRKITFTNTHCAVCGKGAKYKVRFKSLFKVEDFNSNTFLSRKIPGKSHYRMVGCKKCGLLYSNPIIKERFISNLYTESSVPLHSDLENASNIYLSYVSQILKKISKDSSILDIGCGNGFFISKIKRLGYKNVFGVEPSRESIQFLPKNLSSRNIKVGLYKRNMFPKNKFDLICFFQVFDHLTDPNKFLRDCFYNLKSGGYIFALMHDTGSLSLKILQDKSPIIDVQHIYLFNKENLKSIFSKNKYEVIKVFSTYSKYSLAYWIKMGPFPRFLKSLVRKIGENSLVDIPITLPAGNMAIIAFKK